MTLFSHTQKSGFSCLSVNGLCHLRCFKKSEWQTWHDQQEISTLKVAVRGKAAAGYLRGGTECHFRQLNPFQSPVTSEMSLTKQNSESLEQDLIQSLLQVHKHLLERTRLVPFSPDQYPSTKIAEKWEIKSSFILKHAQLLKLKHSPRMNFFSAPGVLFSSCVQGEKDLRLDYVILCWEGDNHCR